MKEIVGILGKLLSSPRRVYNAISRERVKKLINGLRHGEFDLVQEQIAKVLGDGDMRVKAVDVLTHDVSERLEDYETITLPQTDHPIVSIIIPVYNQFNYTYLCLKSILLHSEDVPYEVIIADDCSTDLTQRIKELVPGVRVARTEKNLRFLLNCNHAAKHVRGKYILFLNNDTQVQPNWLRPLVELIEREECIGMVGSKLIYPNGKLQEAGGIVWKDGSAWNYGNCRSPEMPEFNYVKETDYISGAAIMIRRTLWEEIGGFDERFAPAYCEDSDLAFAVRAAGYKVMYQPQSVVVHFEGVSNGTDTTTGLKAYQVENQKKLYEKWETVFSEQQEPGQNVFTARDRSTGRKTILFVDHYVPTYDKDAGSRTVFAYLKLFVDQGFSVKFMGNNFSLNGEYGLALEQMGVEVIYGGWYRRNWKRWAEKNADQFDYVFLNRPLISANYIDFFKEKTNAKIIYYGHDLHFLRTQREYELVKDEKLLKEAENWKKKEFALMRKADMSYYPSSVEACAVKEIDPSVRVKAIPAYLFEDVADVEYYASKRRDLFFIGGFAHKPNVDAVKWLAKEILPELRKLLPDIVVHVAGSAVTKEIQALEGNGLKIEGRISDEQLEQFYAQCRLNIVPLRFGAGIKGKVVESMRYGLPVVTTACGAEGIEDAEDCLVLAETAQEFAQKIAQLYADEEKLQAIAKAGTEYVRTHYSQENAVKVLNEEFGFYS